MVEGSCKFVVPSRFKRPGSRWSREGLERMLALKLMRLNHHWQRLWPHLKAA
jgi:predicted component of type VI protein secretion system